MRPDFARLFACCVFLWLTGRPASAEVKVEPALAPEAAATVNGQAIPKHLVEVFLKNDREALGLDLKSDTARQQLAELPAAILDELVDRALIAQAVHTRGIEPAAAALDADEKRLITFCGDEARYAEYTAQNGFTRQEYREHILRPAANGRAMIDALTRDVTVPDEEVRADYEARQGDAVFQRPEQVAGEHILINARTGVLMSGLEQTAGLKPDTPQMDAAIARETARLRQHAETIRAEATAPGADFVALAKKYSDDPGTRDRGGSLGTFAHGVHPAALDDAFFALRPGEVGPVVQTDFGFHVIRVRERFPAGKSSLTDASAAIRRSLLQTKAARVLQNWLAQARTQAAVVVRDAHDLPGMR